MENTIESTVRKFLVSVKACRNTVDRYAYGYRVFKMPELQIALDWALERGLVSYGTTNASARAWSRGASEGLLYLTKAGRAWLNTRGEEISKAEWAAFQARIDALKAAREGVQP